MKAFSDEELAATRARVVKAGAERIARFGLAKTTIREVCADAEVAPGSFYLLFPSKDELFAEIVVAEVAAARTRNRAAMAADLSSPPEERIRGFLERLVKDIEKSPALAQFYREDSRAESRRALVSARGGGAFASISSSLREMVCAWIAEGMVEGDASAIAEIVQTLIFLSVNRRQIAGGVGRRLVESYVGFVASGIARKGERT